MRVSNPFTPPGRLPCAVVQCRACARLVAWREAQAGRVPPRYLAWVERHGFWARPLPAFGDRRAWLAIVGLAPAAQGANRTGRLFTGDRSGDFLFSALHRAGLATSAGSVSADDGLRLRGALITAAVRCAPPQNAPRPDELRRCAGFLRADLAALGHLRVVLVLGRLAHDAALRLLKEQGSKLPGDLAFGHGKEWRLAGGVSLLDAYHVSQQNTFTGRLTAAMFDDVLRRCKELAGDRGRLEEMVGGAAT
jgi:uracil-DNA glycosylase